MGPQFNSWAEKRLPLLHILISAPQSGCIIDGCCLCPAYIHRKCCDTIGHKIGHDRFLPCPFLVCHSQSHCQHAALTQAADKALLIKSVNKQNTWVYPNSVISAEMQCHPITWHQVHCSQQLIHQLMCIMYYDNTINYLLMELVSGWASVAVVL
jgi:hypothetical protein